MSAGSLGETYKRETAFGDVSVLAERRNVLQLALLLSSPPPDRQRSLHTCREPHSLTRVAFAQPFSILTYDRAGGGMGAATHSRPSHSLGLRMGYRHHTLDYRPHVLQTTPDENRCRTVTGLAHLTIDRPGLEPNHSKDPLEGAGGPGRGGQGG